MSAVKTKIMASQGKDLIRSKILMYNKVTEHVNFLSIMVIIKCLN
jgi:hypothetical protein